MADMIRSPMYATGTGILMYASKEIAEGERTPPGETKQRPSMINSIGGWFKEMFWTWNH